VKELRKLLGISHSKVYQAMKNKELRAVKCGKRDARHGEGPPCLD
jgi:excisionase family DNA binding protein